MKAVEVQRIYKEVLNKVAKRSLKLRVPLLKRADGHYTVTGLTLVFFAARMGRVGTKAELLRFLRRMRCGTTDPQPRHLGMQKGFNMLTMGCYHPVEKRVLKRGEYSLLNLDETHPSSVGQHRLIPRAFRKGYNTFNALKQCYGCRCACCGSLEGERHLKNDHLITVLERGHRDPRRPLTPDNCIPVCTMCNHVYKNHAVFNKRGFIVSWLNNGTKVSWVVQTRFDIAPPGRPVTRSMTMRLRHCAQSSVDAI